MNNLWKKDLVYWSVQHHSGDTCGAKLLPLLEDWSFSDFVAGVKDARCIAIIKHRFGIETERKTHRELALLWGIGRERVRQLQNFVLKHVYRRIQRSLILAKHITSI